MNRLEERMVEVLRELKETYGALSIRAEFEEEGTKLEEMLRFKEIAMAAGLNLTLKIGGCESMRDMLESRIVGVNTLAAPMIESAYALKKYLLAVAKVFPREEREHLEILCNIETMTALKNFEGMLGISEISGLDGIVVERVDLCFSQGMPEAGIDDPKINTLVRDVLTKAKKAKLTTTIGGGVSANSIEFFKDIRDVLTRYETRKVTFETSRALKGKSAEGILKAIFFETLWLKNKMTFQQGIYEKDRRRLDLLSQRYGDTFQSDIPVEAGSPVESPAALPGRQGKGHAS